MDHEHVHDEDDDTMGKSCPMKMIFHVGNCEAILFPKWIASDVGTFIGALIGIFLLSVFYEALKYFREKLFNHYSLFELSRSQITTDKEGEQKPIFIQRTIKQQIFNWHHVVQSILHFIQVAISFLLMLLVMTYNVWIFLVIVFGAAVGYFCFGWIRNKSVDITEHCH